MKPAFLAAFVLLLLGGCAFLQKTPTQGPGAVDVVWRGEVRIDHTLVLPRGSRLTLEPGTLVRFAYHDDDGDGWGDVSLRIEGEVRALGTAKQPVVFTSDAPRTEPGQWGELRVDFGEIDLRYTVIEGSTRGLHAHFSHGQVTDSAFRRNVDGTRLGESRLSIEHCLFAGQVGKGFNARRSRIVMRKNYFRSNRFGVFLFEGDDGSTFEQNVFRDNETAFRLGDFFEGTVVARNNDWGSTPPDSRSSESGSSARLDTTQVMVSDAGPRRWPFWAPVWRVSLGGFVDASPAIGDEGVYAASWSGLLARIGLLDGRVLAGIRLPDVIDSAPALGPTSLGISSWDRRIRLLRRGDLAPLDEVKEVGSTADDHRQAGSAFSSTTLYGATWAGIVRAFDTAQGALRLLWSFQADGPFRADLMQVGSLVLAPCQDGNLYALDSTGGLVRWRFSAGQPLLSGAAADAGRVYFADRTGTLRALELSSGQSLWEMNLGAPVWYAPPLLEEGALFQGDDSGKFSRIETSTGRIIWSRRLVGGIRSRAAYPATGAVAVGTSEGLFFLLDSATGFERDCFQANGPIFSSAAIAGSRTIFGSRDGFLYAIDARVNDVTE